MSIELGGVPDDLKVHLSPGADFDPVLVLLDEDGAEMDWPDGSVVTLRFARNSFYVEETWTAVVTGAEAAFNKDKATVDATIAAKRGLVRLYVVVDDDDDLWASGKVVVHD